MFHRAGKKGVSTQTKPLKDLVRIVGVEQLLSEEKRSVLLEQLKENCVLESLRFDSLCTSLIQNLVNHCQGLPDSSNSYYAHVGGLLDYALNRTDAALALFKHYLIADEHADFSEEQKLWQYALFSAALLQGMGKLHSDYLIELYDNNGHFLKTWNALLESLVLLGSHYRYSFQKEVPSDLRRRLNSLMARLLMPISGFSWIASNPQVLTVWLALLDEDLYSAGTLGAILIRADAIAKQRYFKHRYLHRAKAFSTGPLGRASTFAGGPSDISDREQQVGIEFIQWLIQMLESNIIMINKAPLLLIPEGVLMSPDIFKWFIRDHPEYKNWQAIQKALLSLGLHRQDANGNFISRFEQTNTQQMHSGIVISDYALLLPDTVHFHNLQTGKTYPLSATELIFHANNHSYFTEQHALNNAPTLMGLNHLGKWEALTPTTSSFTPSLTPVHS